MRILIFGDSITQGFWDTDGGWATRLRRHFDEKYIIKADEEASTIFNLGVSADTSFDLLKRIEAEITARQREQLAIIIAIGINDSKIEHGKDFTDVDRFQKNLSEIYIIASKFTDNIMFIGLTPVDEKRTIPVNWADVEYRNERINDFDDVLKAFCQKKKVTYIPIFDRFFTSMKTENLLYDGLHPNAKGHELIYGIILNNLKLL